MTFHVYFVYHDETGIQLKSGCGHLRFVQGLLLDWLRMCEACGFKVASAQIVRES